jgi:hypothetical protein
MLCISIHRTDIVSFGGVGSKMEKRDGVDLMFQLGARWERIFFI